MIYTVTLNPSLDYIVDVENFQLGMTNRTCAEQIRPGGKGVNVSLMLQNLGWRASRSVSWRVSRARKSAAGLQDAACAPTSSGWQRAIRASI